MELIENTALITVNATLIVQLVSFLIFLFVINRIMFRPLQSVMDERTEHINGMRQEVQNSIDETNKLLAELRQRELKAKENAFHLQKELESAGADEASSIHKETMDEVAKHTAAAERAIQAQILEARKGLQEESESIARDIMEKVLNRSVVL